jgi:glycosyltransferase involved in cell wall biosynthesis
MRILVLGNLANDGYSVAKELRKMGKDVDLAVNTSDFAMAFPEWEDGNVSTSVDPYSVNRNQLKDTWVPPPWIHYFDFKNNLPRKGHLMSKIMARIDVIRMIREYNIVETHVPWYIYAQFSGKPYVVYDAGAIRYFPFRNSFRDKLARRGYRKARSIMVTNPDTFEIFDRLPYLDHDRIYPIPFAIDPEKYRPVDATELRARCATDDELLLFSPSRQIWSEKGNDKMIRAYARFGKEFPKSKFVMVSWSVDEQRSMDLVNSLGLEDRVVWIKPVAKNHLIQYYGAADIVLDQFVLGSWGTSTPEAMSCGKPVLMFYKNNYITRAFGEEEPPILNSFTEDDIYSNLVRLAKDRDYALEVGKKSREWIIRTHHPRLVAQRHLDILEARVK